MTKYGIFPTKQDGQTCFKALNAWFDSQGLTKFERMAFMAQCVGQLIGEKAKEQNKDLETGLTLAYMTMNVQAQILDLVP